MTRIPLPFDRDLILNVPVNSRTVENQNHTPMGLVERDPDTVCDSHDPAMQAVSSIGGGGLFHFRVQRQLGYIIDKIFKESKTDEKKDIVS